LSEFEAKTAKYYKTSPQEDSSENTESLEIHTVDAKARSTWLADHTTTINQIRPVLQLLQ